MVSSDDEVEDCPKLVSEYYFEDDKEEPISFAVMPVCWNTSEAVQGLAKKISVRGKIDEGHGKLYKRVKAWKFDISGQKPVISVLSENNKWIKLEKPRISYGEFSRTVLITVNFLHLVKRNPELHGKELWDKLSKNLRLLGDKPSLSDLTDHKALMEKAVEHDDSLKKSKYLMKSLEKNLQKKNKDLEDARTKGKDTFIVDDDDLDEGDSIDREDGSNDEEDDDEDIFDSVCSICDEGGSILCCDGVCARSFHATREAAEDVDSQCKSLGFTPEEVEAMQTFKCQNCRRKRHQCYSCGQLGSSDRDKEPGTAEVFQCVNATCGYFYHPGCVSKLLHRGDEGASKALQKAIAAGDTFTCPLHVCFVCRQPEDKTDSESKMAVCKRCPTAYHKKCLPRKITFEGDDGEGIVPRAWDNLLVGRILIYCLKHDIDENLGTPRRNHIKFPGDAKKESQLSTQRVLKPTVEPQKKKPYASHSRLGPGSKPKLTIQDNRSCKTDTKISKVKGTHIDTPRNSSFEKKAGSTKVELKSHEQTDLGKPKIFGKTSNMSVVELDPESKTRVLEILKEASSRVTLDDVIRENEKLIPDCEYSLKMDQCKAITKGKVQNFCEAIQSASKKLEAGGSIADVQTVCEQYHLDQVAKWKSKLKVYLAPFIHASRYTSFGRHFTKREKLMEIVGKIHWYVNRNDTVVDFCCGSNEFSLLMNDKLASVGKTCNFNNYDIFRPKDDFCFEKRNWMKVQPKELPNGDQLIIGLNPPFGVRGKRANQFINKALEFKPKLIILIVPSETQRLDKKKSPYDLVWSDKDKLSGKSFYLPGVTEKDNQVDDWNNDPPILSLWSRPDWTSKHKAIAKKHGHQLEREREGNHANSANLEQSLEKPEHVADIRDTKVEDISAFAEPSEETAGGEKLTAFKENNREIHLKGFPQNKRLKVNSSKKRHGAETDAKKDVESSRKRCRSSPLSPHEVRPHHSPANARDRNRSPPLRFQTSPPNLDRVEQDQVPFHTNYRDERCSRRSKPRGYEEPFHDRSDRSAVYGSMRREFPGAHYDHQVGIHSPPVDVHPGGGWCLDAGPHADYPLRSIPPHTDYSPRPPAEWDLAYLRGSDGHGAAIHPYIESEQRFRPSPFPGDTGYGRAAPMSGVDPDHARMGGYDPDPRYLSGPGQYHQPPRHGYSGIPMGFASRPHGEPFHHPQSSSGSGGWIND